MSTLTAPKTSTLSVVRAFIKALHEEMALDEKVICIGEDIGKKGGCWGTFTGLEAKFGENRVVEMPIAEAGYSLFAVGTTLAGYRPVCEYMFADFATLGAEAIMNVSPKMRYISGGKFSCPITFIFPQGGGSRSGCQHSQSVESWLTNIPGLKIVAPTFPADITAFLKASIRDNDPVAFVYHKGLLGLAGEVPDEVDVPALTGAARVVKEGKDLTIVAYHRALLNAIEAAKQVEAQTGMTIEIIDPRVLMPFDKDTVFKSIRKTGRLLVAHEAPERGGFGQIVSSWVSEDCFFDLKSPVVRVGGRNTVIPFGKTEDYCYPQIEDIKEGIMRALR
jgi:pyruvate dehydrogenase E1 component beta subunit